jgi:NADPH2:quinone reductase
MKAVVYSATGGPEVLRLIDRDPAEPGAGEVRIRIHVSGVNPTDWKSRQGAAPGQPTPFPEVVPHQDGAGVVDAVGEGVARLRPGSRVWVWEAAWQRATGTAQEFVVLPQRHVLELPDDVSFDVGASLGIPALTAHRTLTVLEGGPDRLLPGALEGRTVLVAGGAGAVGHAAVQLARWAGARVLATVSGPEKGALATRAGAHHVIDYHAQDAAEAVRDLAPDGVDLVVEVAPGPNASLDRAVLAPAGTIAAYATNGGEEFTVPIRPHMVSNTRFQFVLVYTVPAQAKEHAVEDVSAAAAAGVLGVGGEHGLPLHRYTLADVAAAHSAVESGVIGKVLVDVLVDVLPGQDSRS